jgi:hypothetical protein
MAAEVDLRGVFQESLNCAIAHGQRPSRWIGLGDRTRVAIEAVAYEHPDATADHIADAYDAFARDHEASGPVASAAGEPPKRLVVRRARFNQT